MTTHGVGSSEHSQQTQHSEQTEQTQQKTQTSQAKGPQEMKAKPKFEPLESPQGSQVISEEALKQNIESINKLLDAKDTDVTLDYDELSSPNQVSIIDKDSGDVLTKIPPQAAIEIASKAKDYILGMIVDKKV